MPVAPATLKFRMRVFYHFMFKEMRFYKFLNQVKQEVKKIVWPERKEFVILMCIVIATVLVFSLITALLDYGIHSVISFILNIGK